MLYERGTAEQKAVLEAREIDSCYKEEGEQSLPPLDMTEHMYLVVRSIFDRGEKKEYILKKLDVIKLGRVKFRVKEISIASNLDKYKERKRKLERR